MQRQPAALAVKELFARGQRSDSAVFAALRSTHSAPEIFEGLQAARRELAAARAASGHDETEEADEADEADEQQDSNAGDDAVSALRKLLADPSVAALPDDMKIRGVSPLIYACSTYDEDLGVAIVALVRRSEVQTSGTRPASFSSASATAVAAASGQADEKPADAARSAVIDEKHDYHYRPLHYACEASMPRLVAALVSAGAGLEHTTIDMQLQRGSVQAGGRRPLHFAARALGDDSVSMIRTLLEAGADPMSRDLDGNTPYVLACMRHGSASPSAELLRAALANAPGESGGGTAGVSDPPTIPPSASWLAEKAKSDRAAGNARVQSMWHVPPALREVFSTPKLLSADECLSLVTQVTKFTSVHGWLSDRHRGYATTDVRSAKMPLVDAWVRKHVSERLFPALAARFGFDVESFVFRDLFFVYYDGDTPGAQNSVGPHRDGSVLSFNVLLNEPAAFDGGGTWFDHTQQTHYIGQGDALVHSGKLRHAGMPVTRGKRFILVGFVDAGLEPGEEGLELHFSDPS